MTVAITRSISAEQRKLRKKLRELKRLEAELAQQELDLATLSAELRAVDILYVRRVGARLAKVQLIEARIAEILARLNPDDQVREKRARETRQHAEKTEKKARDAANSPEKNMEFSPSERMRELYREAAKNVHPDLASSEMERAARNHWMVEINAAYQSGDEELLASLLEGWLASPESVQGDSPDAEFERTVRKIARARERLKEIQVEMERLKTSFAFSLRARMRIAEKEGRDLLEEMVQKIEKQLVSKQKLLDDLVKNAPPVWNIEW